MSEHLTREDLVVAATKGAVGARPDITASMHEYSLIVDAALPVIVKAVTDRVRARHAGKLQCIHLPPRGHLPAPCPTVRLADAIDADLGVER